MGSQGLEYNGPESDLDQNLLLVELVEWSNIKIFLLGGLDWLEIEPLFLVGR